MKHTQLQWSGNTLLRAARIALSCRVSVSGVVKTQHIYAIDMSGLGGTADALPKDDASNSSGWSEAGSETSSVDGDACEIMLDDQLTLPVVVQKGTTFAPTTDRTVTFPPGTKFEPIAVPEMGIFPFENSYRENEYVPTDDDQFVQIVVMQPQSFGAGESPREVFDKSSPAALVVPPSEQMKRLRHVCAGHKTAGVSKIISGATIDHVPNGDLRTKLFEAFPGRGMPVVDAFEKKKRKRAVAGAKDLSAPDPFGVKTGDSIGLPKAANGASARPAAAAKRSCDSAAAKRASATDSTKSVASSALAKTPSKTPVKPANGAKVVSSASAPSASNKRATTVQQPKSCDSTSAGNNAAPAHPGACSVPSSDAGEREPPSKRRIVVDIRIECTTEEQIGAIGALIRASE